MSIIQVENISKQYTIGKKESYGSLRDEIMQTITAPFRRRSAEDSEDNTIWALKDVSFEVKEGEVLGIIGRNGAGKSTLLKILSRITEPTEGRITMRGRVASLLEVGTGFHPELTGRENILLNGALLGMTRQEIKSKFDEIVAFAEIEKFLDTPVKRYSSGMYVRLAFAVAAHLEPEILIVDEVLAVGDVEFQKKCMGKMGEVATGGRTVLFVSHNMAAVNRLCSKCIMLDRGRLESIGSTAQVVEDYMSYNVSQGGTYEQEHDPKKDMNLRKVILNPQSDSDSTDVRYDQPIVIRVEYEVNREVLNCTVWLGLQTIEGIMVLATCDYDSDHDKLGERKPGYYVTDVKISEGWLNFGKYQIIAGIAKNNPIIVYDRQETIVFNVLEINSPGSLIRAGARKGILQPFLPWVAVEKDSC